MTDSVTFTHCHICEQLCGLEVTVREGRIVSIRPDKQNPHSWRDFCIKGQRAGEVVHSSWRVIHPMRRRGDSYVAASYEEAIDDIAARLRTIVDRDGPNAVAGYLGNPGGFNFGLAAFHNGFLQALGTHQLFGMFSIDSNAYHVAVGAMFGLEWLALIPDIDATDCALLIGTNPAVSKFCWLGKVPNGWRRLLDRIRDGADLIVVDPRFTETAAKGTMHLAPVPDSDWALVLAMLQVIFANGWESLPTQARLTSLADLKALAASVALEDLAAICEVPVETIREAARRFATAERAFAYAATGPGLGRNGAVAHWLTMALNVVTNRVDVAGGRYMPNWPMSQAIYKASVSPDSTVKSRVRGLAPVVGFHSIAELADEITTPGEGQVRALFMSGGNPVSSSADGGKLADALGSLDLLVAIDLFQRESQQRADWIIPGQHFLERGELHVGIHALNDRPYIQSARVAIESPPGVRPEWTFFRDLAAALGLSLFGGQIAPHPDAVSESLLAIGGQIGMETIRAAEHGIEFGERTMGHLWAFMDRSGRTIDMAPPAFVARLRAMIEEAAIACADPHGVRIISRRRNGMMNGWLAETSGYATPDETASSVELNPEDARTAGVADGDDAVIRSDIGEIVARVRVSDAVRPGAIVLAQGWGAPLFDADGAEVSRIGIERNKLVSDTDLDPLSAVPRLNGTRATVSRATRRVGNSKVDPALVTTGT
ncbi:molybdopterin-containing oxidoreductase family protein [Sphingomonas immobilis]|uniref:Molybdopterin-dependent oxidoreductase n=1 Tax=Sphingomonas immobilis TaxID=3063997 RepID=A0ABT9A258_9SPHN|nr:molybdopterin-dependent oxidoreductase [Sphingomonas sp. CA1-15]MDO7843926.1 molybdopterin-dependent oxidoreductase [Sphingomonas sp. CA1-15]